MVLRRDDVISVLGPVDETMIAEIVSTGASLVELREALGWLHNDEAMRKAGYSPPQAKVAALIDLLETEEMNDGAVPPIPTD